MAVEIKHVFGPVPSRRLGRSLGVDLAPRKVCSFDCVYCQVGRTTHKTIEREAFVAVDHILAEIQEKLKSVPRPDYITLSGSGEPTLHSAIGEIIDGIKKLTDVPVAVMTNGSLFYDAEVRRACRGADLILPTLDAADEPSFQAVHRPEASLTLARLVEGLEALRREYRGQIWLEVFLVAGLNTASDQVRRLRKLIDRINPDRVQLNTAVRPTADAGVRPLSEAALIEIAAALGPKAEVIADFRRDTGEATFSAGGASVLDMIRRRPVTLDDVAAGMGVAREQARAAVCALLVEKKIAAEMRGDREYYIAL